jgi:hypothetical protein
MDISRLIASIALIAFCSACSERNRMATVDGQGLISQGQKLGVHIGDPLPLAVKTLEDQGLVMGGIVLGGNCLSPTKFAADRTVQLVDLSWRKGTVCLGVTHERVSHIGWLYNMLAP